MKHNTKKIIILLLGAVLLLSRVNMNVFALEYGSEWDGYYHNAATEYLDVASTHWAYDAIMRTTEKNWFGGYPDGRFMPDGSITRAEALKVFVVFLGLELEDVTESTFYDVNPNQWYAPYIEAGKDLFPTRTTIQGKTPFQPDMPVTREDTIYALVNALGYQVGAKYVDESVLNMFSDKNSISGDLKTHFAIALKHELVSGFPDGTIRAQDSLTRAEFATLLYRGSFVGHSGNYEAKISKVTVFPVSPLEIEIGKSISLSARAIYTDDTNRQYSNLQPYDAENNGVISLVGTTITGLKEGTTTIKYNDSYLKNDSLDVVVKKPTSNLNIKIYEYPETTEKSTVTVIGEVVDADVSTVDLVANSKDVKVERNGSFSANLSLETGTNNIKFVATNKYGVKAKKNIIIQCSKKEVPKDEEKLENSEVVKMDPLDTHESVVDYVTVTPTTSAEMTIGETITLSAKATYTDKTNKPYSGLSPYDATGNGVIALNGTTITAVKEGTAVIKYNDSYLRNKSLIINVKKPTDAPTLKITDYDTTTKDETVTVKGTVKDKNGNVSLMCNSKDVSVKNDGSFSAKVSLNIGTNNIRFVAKNTYGVETSKTIVVKREEAETVIILAPDDSTTTEKKEFEVAEKPIISTKDIIGGKQVIIECSGATIYYTKDNMSTPTTKSDSGKHSIYFTVTSTRTIKAFAVKEGYKNSDIATKTVTVDKTSSPIGTEASGKLNLSCGTDGATIYYTTDGSTPNPNSTNSFVYSSGIDVRGVTTVKAIAILNGNSNSDIYTWNKY